MWIWYFIGFIIIVMLLIQFISSRKDEPFVGLKGLIPKFNYEAGKELTPHTQNYIENLTGQSMPYFETVISLVEDSPQKLTAEWSIDKNLKKQFTMKYGQEFWHNSQEILRVFHQNAVPEPYYHDYPINMDKGKTELNIEAPGETLNSQIGIITETGSFIPLAQSNDVTIPKKD